MENTITVPIIVGFATVLATIIGPVAAVFATRWIDHHRERRQRRLEVFRSLMRSRRTPISADFVGALNLVEVEFYDDEKVIKAWKDLLNWFGRVGVLPPSHEQTWIEEGQRLRALLLDAIARSLGINIPQLDIFHGGYTPKGWGEVEEEQHSIRKMFASIAAGKMAFPVIVFPAEMPQGPASEPAKQASSAGHPPTEQPPKVSV